MSLHYAWEGQHGLGAAHRTSPKQKFARLSSTILYTTKQGETPTKQPRDSLGSTPSHSCPATCKSRKQEVQAHTERASNTTISVQTNATSPETHTHANTCSNKRDRPNDWSVDLTRDLRTIKRAPFGVLAGGHRDRKEGDGGRFWQTVS